MFELKMEPKSDGFWWRVEQWGLPVFIGTLQACAAWIADRSAA